LKFNAKYLKKVAFVGIVAVAEHDLVPELFFVMPQFLFDVGYSPSRARLPNNRKAGDSPIGKYASGINDVVP